MYLGNLLTFILLVFLDLFHVKLKRQFVYSTIEIYFIDNLNKFNI